MLAFDTNLAPIVGQQVTLTRATARSCTRASICSRRAPRPASATWWPSAWLRGRRVGFPLRPRGPRLSAPTSAGPAVPVAHLRVARPPHAVTFTAVPPGSGDRIGLDRDGDGVLDGDED